MILKWWRICLALVFISCHIWSCCLSRTSLSQWSRMSGMHDQIEPNWTAKCCFPQLGNHSQVCIHFTFSATMEFLTIILPRSILSQLIWGVILNIPAHDLATYKARYKSLEYDQNGGNMAKLSLPRQLPPTTGVCAMPSCCTSATYKSPTRY